MRPELRLAAAMDDFASTCSSRSLVELSLDLAENRTVEIESVPYNIIIHST